MGWDKITLYKFQQIDAINSNPDLSDIDKTLFSTCQVFNYTEFQLDNLPLRKVEKLTSRMTKIFNTPFEPKPFKRIGKYFINYEISKITFGQYVELSFFLSNKPMQNAHRVLASVSNFLFGKHKTEDHAKKSDYFLRQSIVKIIGSLSLIAEKFTAFNKEYAALFGLDKEVNGDVQEDKFNKNWGWHYSAREIAKDYNITLEKAYSLNVREAFHCLSYLKAKAKYEAEQIKHNSHGR